MKKSYVFRKYDCNVSLPLYKYYSNLNFAVDAIENKRIHLEEPKDYNDIYDSAFTLRPQMLKNCLNTKINICKKLRPKLAKKYWAAIDACEETEDNRNFSVQDLIEFICSYDETFNQEELTSNCILAISNGVPIQPSNNRITCFSERNDSLLMWSYYAKNHSGVCLGFDLKKDRVLSKYCSKVNYSHYFSPNDNISFEKFFIKSEEWMHEQEWRIVCNTDNEYIYTSSLQTIILGARISNKKQDYFADLSKKHNLKLFKAIPSVNEYKLHIIPAF